MIVQILLGGGRILLLADAWAWNGGLFQHPADASGGTGAQGGDGFCTIGGKNIFCFPTRTGREPTGDREYQQHRPEPFNYAADIYGAPDETAVTRSTI